MRIIKKLFYTVVISMVLIFGLTFFIHAEENDSFCNFNDYELYIADEKVTEDNIFKIRKNVEYISENSNNLFVCNSVEEEMYFYLKNKIDVKSDD